MDGIYNIREWLDSSIKKVLEANLVVDAHIDEFVNLFNEADIFESSVQIFKECTKELSTLKTESVSIYLSIELKSRSRKPSSIIKSYGELKSQVQQRMMPEVIIYCPKEPEILPLVELHRVPISRDVIYLGERVNVFLEEKRTMEDILENRLLQKELLFIYNPVSSEIS